MALRATRPKYNRIHIGRLLRSDSKKVVLTITNVQADSPILSFRYLNKFLDGCHDNALILSLLDDTLPTNQCLDFHIFEKTPATLLLTLSDVQVLFVFREDF